MFLGKSFHDSEDLAPNQFFYLSNNKKPIMMSLWFLESLLDIVCHLTKFSFDTI